MVRKFWVKSTYYTTEVQSGSKEGSYHRLAGQSKMKNYTAVLIQRICPADILSANMYFPNNRGVSPCDQGSVVQVSLGGMWCPEPCHQWISWLPHSQPWARAERDWHSEWSFMRFAGKTCWVLSVREDLCRALHGYKALFHEASLSSCEFCEGGREDINYLNSSRGKLRLRRVRWLLQCHTERNDRMQIMINRFWALFSVCGVGGMWWTCICLVCVSVWYIVLVLCVWHMVSSMCVYICVVCVLYGMWYGVCGLWCACDIWMYVWCVCV